MKVRTKTVLGVAFTVALMLWVGVGGQWARQRSLRRRVDTWLDHHFRFVGKGPQYYDSYDAWRRAGREIPGIGKMLLERYRAADSTAASRAASEYERVILAHGMGAIGTDETVRFLMRVADSAESEWVRTYAITGLGYNLDHPEVPRYLLRLAQDPREGIQRRASILNVLVDLGYGDAMWYAQDNAPELLTELEASGIHGRILDAFAAAFTSQAASARAGTAGSERSSDDQRN